MAILREREGLALARTPRSFAFDVLLAYSCRESGAVLVSANAKDLEKATADGLSKAMLDRLTLTSRAPEMGESEIRIDAIAYQGEPIEIAFNPTFIVDVLKVIDSEQVIIEMKAPNKPGVIKVGADFTYVVMPVSLQ